MSHIYRTNFRDSTDIFPECLIIGAIPKEIWFVPDTSVLVLFSQLFIYNRFDRYTSSAYTLIKEISTKNINISPIAIVEAARNNRDINDITIDNEKMNHIFLAILRAQCIDINSINSKSVSNWKLSPTRIKLITSTFINFQANSLEELAIQLVKEYSKPISFTPIKAAKNLEKEVIKPMLELARTSYIYGQNNLDKIKIFKEGVKNIKRYSPKIMDFCLQSILFCEQNNSLLKGAIKKFKTEIDRCAIDIAWCEIAATSNVNQYFSDITLINIFFTCDKLQHLYSNIGNKLDIKLTHNKSETIYHPDFSDYKQLNKDCFDEITSVFKIHSPNYLKQHLIKLYNESKYEQLIMEKFKIYKGVSGINITYHD